MFRHIYVYRLKCLLRDRQLLFWTFLYPVVLATLFSLAFSNIGKAVAFTSVRVAVVDNAAYRADTAFQGALRSVSGGDASQQKLFDLQVIPLEQAKQNLDDNKITGYILMDNTVKVVVKDTGISQTMIKQFVDSYLQTRSAYGTMIHANPAQAASIRQPDTSAYLKDVAPGRANADPMMTYFYALIAMAALFGGFWGHKEITDIQANLSPCGARVNLAPVHKLKAFVYSFSASVTVHFLALSALVAYLGLVLGIDFGNQLGYILIACLAGSFMGVSFGAAMSAISGKNESLKVALMICVSIGMSFLSGLMVSSIKYTVTHAVPLLNWINPANLLADAFYALYYYSTYTRFFTNIGLLMAFTAAFCLVVYFVTRRQKYASL